jgi:NADPH:quinone reductase-like Zn-dependent oxidoreductase
MGCVLADLSTRAPSWWSRASAIRTARSAAVADLEGARLVEKLGAGGARHFARVRRRSRRLRRPCPDEVSDATAAVMLINTLAMRDLLRAVEEAWDGPPRPVLQTAAGSSVARLFTAAAVRHRYPLVNVIRSERGAAELRERFRSVPVVVSTSDPGWAGQARAALGGQARVILDPGRTHRRRCRRAAARRCRSQGYGRTPTARNSSPRSRGSCP